MGPGLPLRVFSTQICFFSRPVCLGYYEKSRDICVFWSDKLIKNFNATSNTKITLHYSVYMRTSGEKVRISDEAERVQSASYSHITVIGNLCSQAKCGAFDSGIWLAWYVLNTIIRRKLFCNFPFTRLQNHQQHHAAAEVALTVRSMEKIQTFTIV